MIRQQLLARLRELPADARVITALDVPGLDEVAALAGRLGPGARCVKVGLELFSAAGPQAVRLMRDQGREVFLDLKYHDIPNTVAAAARQAVALGASFCTIHAQNGRRALAAAAEALAAAPVAANAPQGRRPALLAVTVLTSLTPEELQETGPGPDTLAERVARLARLAWESGCDGLVCSPADLPALRAKLGDDPLAVTPGVRPAGAAVGDQRRVATPAEAVAAGADFLVVGRPITRAEDPGAALGSIAAEIEDALSRRND